MPRRHDQRDLSAAAQQYLLALRVLVGPDDTTRVTAAQIARHLGVTTQAASEMFRRLLADGLVSISEGRELHLTPAGRRQLATEESLWCGRCGNAAGFREVSELDGDWRCVVRCR